jgi:hypothetical protein
MVDVVRGGDMSGNAFQESFELWKRERKEIEQEIKLFLAEGRKGPAANLRARQVQFSALIERRNAAFRNMMQTAWPKEAATALPPAPSRTADVADGPAQLESSGVSSFTEVAESELKAISLDDDSFKFDLATDQTPPARAPLAAMKRAMTATTLGDLTDNSFESHFRRQAAEDGLLRGPVRPRKQGVGRPEVRNGHVISAKFLKMWRTRAQPKSQRPARS